MEDFEAAVNPDRFALFVINLRTLDKALTSNLTDFNVLSEGEAKYRKFVRRQVVASRSLSAGDKIQLKDLVMKRTGLTDGFDSANDIIGLELKSDIRANEHIKRSVVNAKRKKT